MACLQRRRGRKTEAGHRHQDIALESYRQDLRRVERLNTELLVRVAALEHGRDNPIKIDSLEPLPMPPPGGLGPGSVLVEIVDDMDDEWNQAITEDQAEGVVRRVTIEEGGVFRIVGEEYGDGEDVEDVLRWIEARDREIPRYPPVPSYDDPNYIPDVQQ